MNSDHAILLIAHGTEDATGTEETYTLARRMAELAGEPVHTCFIDHAEPGMDEAIDQLAGQGARRITTIPVILTTAGHVKDDIPAAVAGGETRNPGLRFDVLPAIGVREAMIGILEARFDAALADRREVSLDETVLVFVGRGSSDPDANSDIFKIARLFWERRRARAMTVGFIGVTFPHFKDALEQAAALNLRRVVVMPYFLFSGVLLRRIDAIAAEFAAQHTDIDLAVTQHIGPDPALARLLLPEWILARREDGRSRLATA